MTKHSSVLSVNLSLSLCREVLEGIEWTGCEGGIEVIPVAPVMKIGLNIALEN